MSAQRPTLVHVGTYTEKLFFVDGKGEGIHVFALDPATGELTPTGAVTRTPTPVCIRFVPD